MKYYAMFEDENNNLKLEVVGCPRNCASCKHIKPLDGLHFDRIEEETFIRTACSIDRNWVIIYGDDPLFCGNRDYLTKVLKKIKEKSNPLVMIKTKYNWDKIKHYELFNYVDRVVTNTIETNIIH